MKPVHEMTIGEIELTIHQHEWITEKERREMFIALASIKTNYTMILQRLASYKPTEFPCDCHSCEMGAKQVAKQLKQKDEKVHFSLD